MSFLSDLAEDSVGPMMAMESKVNGCQEKRQPTRKSVRYDDSLVQVLEYSLDDDSTFPTRPLTPPPRPPTPPPHLNGEEGEEEDNEGEGEGEGETEEARRNLVSALRIAASEEDVLFDLPPVPQIPPSPPLESRDNPFLPGGELEKEAEDLLKHAVIIRDKFYLDADGNRLPLSPAAQQQLQLQLQQQQDRGDGPGHPEQGPGVEETMTAATCVNNQVAAEPKRRENGKVSEASPDNVKVDMVGKDGQGGAPDEEAADAKDKKKRNKCCSVM